MENNINPKVSQTAVKQLDSNSRLPHFIFDIFAIILIVYLIGQSIFSLIQVDKLIENIITVFIYFVAVTIYYIPFEHKFQKSPGKFLSNTKVVDKNGNKPTPTQILLRNYCRLIPLDPLSYLLFNRGIHDRIAGTYLVKDNK